MTTPNRYYSSVAIPTTLAGPIAATDTSFGVLSLTGYPSVPFTVYLDGGTASAELITVTALSGLTITSCLRGVDGSTAMAHSAGASFVHETSARDYTEP